MHLHTYAHIYERKYVQLFFFFILLYVYAHFLRLSLSVFIFSQRFFCSFRLLLFPSFALA